MEPTVTHSHEHFDTYLFGCEGSWGTKTESGRAQAARISQDLGAERLFLLNASTFNAVVVSVNDFAEPQRFQTGSRGIDIFPRTQADGVAGLVSGDAFWLGTGDCPTVVLSDGNMMVACHAGRDSLIVRSWLPEFSNRRGRPSVIDAAMARFPRARRESVRAWIFCGIAGKSFIHALDDPKWGEANLSLYRHVHQCWGEQCIWRDRDDPDRIGISLPDIIRVQLRHHGVTSDRVWHDGIDTYAALNGHQSFKWWSAARGDRNRNGVLIIRRF